MSENHIICKDSLDLAYNIYLWIRSNNYVQAVIIVPSISWKKILVDFFSKRRIPVFYDDGYYEKKIGIMITDKPFNNYNIPCVVVEFENFSKEKKEIIKNVCKVDCLYKLEYTTEVVEKEKKIDWHNYPSHLVNEQINEAFMMAFSVAEKEIDIISPWISENVVNEEFLEIMERTLARGVHIYIRYGIQGGNTKFNTNREEKSKKIAKLMKERFLSYGTAFRIVEDNIHYKLVLCDDKFMLEGSYNYLSFKGDYKNGDRKEGSPFITDKAEINKQRRRYFR